MVSVSADALLDFCWCRVAPVTLLLITFVGGGDGKDQRRIVHTYVHAYYILSTGCGSTQFCVVSKCLGQWWCVVINISCTKQ